MEKLRHRSIFLSLFIPLLAGGIAAYYSPLSFWYDMKEGLIAFLGFLAASVIQVMVVTANFLQSEKLTPVEARRLSKELTKQQYFWVGLLLSCVVSLILVIIGAALKGVAVKVIYDNRYFSFAVDWSSIVVFFVAASVSFVFYRMFALLTGVISLHRLRSQLVISAADREAEEKAKEMQKSAIPEKSFVPADYGAIIKPPDIY